MQVKNEKTKLRNLLDNLVLEQELDQTIRKPVTIYLDQKQLISKIKNCNDLNLFANLCEAYVENYVKH